MKNLLIVGGGNMGFAIAYGIISKNIYKKNNIYFVEKDQSRIAFLKSHKFKVFRTIKSVFSNKKISFEAIILATKPNDISQVSKELAHELSNKSLIISVAAGVTLKKLSSLFKQRQPIARIMPNTPCQIGEGLSAITRNKYISNSHKKIIKKIFQSVGKIIETNESLLDLVTAVSGSGPAYFCYLLECITKSATALGMKKEIASKMALQTGLGTMMLLEKSNMLPELLRGKVTSPKGTTEAAIKSFIKSGFSSTIFSGIKAAKVRARELSKT